MSTMVSLSSMSLKLHQNRRPPPKSEVSQVCEALMTELETQVREVERIARDREKEEKKRHNLPDYSWLVATPVKSYDLPQMERLTLEDLASNVEAKDCSHIITQFRSLIDWESRQPEELSILMKTVIKKYLTEKPMTEEDNMFNWITKSVTNLSGNLRTLRSQSSSKVCPVSVPSEEMVGDTRRVKSMSDFVPHSYSESPV